MQPLVPQVPNLNGTSKQSLIDGYIETLGYLRTAVKVMREHAPNGRDYQTVSPDTFEKAADAWCERTKALEDMIRELEATAYRVMSSTGGR